MKPVLFFLALGFSYSPAYANIGDPFQARCNMGGTCSFACPAQCESGIQVLSQGEFASLGHHLVMGSVEIEQTPVTGLYLALGPGFETSQGPDLRIVLRDSSGIRPMTVVATLDQTTGAQKYALSLDEKVLANYDEVVIYCAKYHVDFGIAKLMRR